LSILHGPILIAEQHKYDRAHTSKVPFNQATNFASSGVQEDVPEDESPEVRPSRRINAPEVRGEVSEGADVDEQAQRQGREDDWIARVSHGSVPKDQFGGVEYRISA
jgi:hypothetical protein